MSKTGEWGDKTIVVLHSTDEHRHKTWCTHYDRMDGTCALRKEKCIGSAHCAHYEKHSARGTIRPEDIPDFVPFISPYETKAKWQKSTRAIAHTHSPFQDLIVGRSPYFDENLVGKLLLCFINTRHQVAVGTVIKQTAERITIETDSGEIKTYDFKVCYQNKLLWIIDNFD
jgi:hypothetical protein